MKTNERMTNPEAIVADLTEKLRVAREALDLAKGCFDAANCEGLQELLNEGGRLSELIQRRLCYNLPDAINAALSALDAPSVSPWREISSAPRDGTRIFTTDGVKVGVSRWVHQYQSGFIVDRFISDMLNSEPHTPTHWQPLPQPPVSQPTP